MTPLRAALTAALAIAVVAAPAAADGTLHVTDLAVDESSSAVHLTVVGEGLPPDVGLDPTSVVATVDGRAVPATAVVADRAPGAAPRVLLVVDTSGSMVGQPMAEAKAAIAEFASSVAAEVQLGLLTFSTAPRLVLEPTADRTRLLGAITDMTAQGETAVYDAVVAAAAALGGAGDRRLVVLSDGGDTVSAAALEQAVAAVTASGVAVDAIGFRTEESVEGALQQLADAGHGQVLAVQTAAELSAALTRTSAPQARALGLRVLVPEDVRGDRALTVEVLTTAGPLRTTVDVALGGATVGPASPPGWWSTRQAVMVGPAAIGLSLLLGSLVLLSPDRGRRRRVRAVLDRYTTAPASAKPDLRTASPVARTALVVADRLADTRHGKDRLTLRLERAAVSLTPAEWVLLSSGAATAGALLLVLVGWHIGVAAPAGALLGWLGPRAWLSARGTRRRKQFEERLPDALQMVASSLSAGYSLAQALDGVVREGTEPLATEFGKALAEARLGMPVESSLQGVADRMASRDFAWVVMAITVQREVGGNLAGILTTVTATMRERAVLKRHVRALSAEGRLSAYILLALPVLLGVYMLGTSRAYVRPLYTTSVGLTLIALAVFLMAFGSFVMSRMVKVEV